MSQEAAHTIAEQYDALLKRNQKPPWNGIAENPSSFVDKSLRGKKIFAVSQLNSQIS
jgi:hypothetical protein